MFAFKKSLPVVEPKYNDIASWLESDLILKSDHPIARLSLLASKFAIEQLAPKCGHWPYPPSELQLMTAAVVWYRPTVICEWGTNVGFSARAFWLILKSFNIPATIHSIDLPAETEHVENVKDLRGHLVKDLPEVRLHLGDGVTRALELAQEERPLFFVDGDHRNESVTRELNAIFAAYPAAPILMHDTHDWMVDDCPGVALRQFMQRNPSHYYAFHMTATLPGMSLLVPRSLLPGVSPEPSAA